MKTVRYKFVEFIPEELEEGVLFVSTKYQIAIHLCPCGCGNKVVTPLSPTDWKLEYKNGSVSLSPSIGNWSFKCKSHYWIKNNIIIWAEPFSDYKIARIREHERKEKKHYYRKKKWEKIKKMFHLIFASKKL